MAPRSQSASEQLIEAHLPLVGHLVRETLGKVPAHVNRDDLTSAAMMALVVAAQGFDPDRGVPFARYAAIRIRGALLDELRGMDWAARSVRTRARELDAVRTQLTAALRRTPTPEETAAAAGISPTELAAHDADLARAHTLSLEGFAPDTGPAIIADHHHGPETLLLMREQLGYLHDAIALLPHRLRHVVTAYFFDQRPMAEIGAELGVSESRVSQLRAEALTILRDGLNTHLDPTALTPARTKRAATTRTHYAQALATGTTKTRLAKTNHNGETRTAA
jgi:RNA polymerase sigma factor for flagellar operon FliA